MIVIVDVCYKHYTTFRAPYDSTTPVDMRKTFGGTRIKKFHVEQKDKRAEKNVSIIVFRKKRKNCHVL